MLNPRASFLPPAKEKEEGRAVLCCGQGPNRNPKGESEVRPQEGLPCEKFSLQSGF